jgi:hypothetical protein
MSPPPHRHRTDAARSLVAVAPLVTRWIERLLAARDPPLTPPQYLALRAIAHEHVSVTELARRVGVRHHRHRHRHPRTHPVVARLPAGPDPATPRSPASSRGWCG